MRWKLLLLPLIACWLLPAFAWADSAKVGDNSGTPTPLSEIADHTAASTPLPVDPDCRWRETGPGAPARTVLMFTGDILLGGRMGKWIEQHGVDYPCQYVAEVLRTADFTFGNLETAVTDQRQSTPGKSQASLRARQNFVFKSSPRYSGAVLAAAGYDCLSLANNHAMDYCGAGLLDTIAALDAASLAHAGAGADAAAAAQGCVVEAGGLRIGVLAYTLIVPAASRAGRASPGVNALAKAYTSDLHEAITRMQSAADIVVVSLHWGQEGSRMPAAYQRAIGRACIDAGARLVIGHHPHVLQGVEHYHGGAIAYSLGNFVFCGASAVVESCILKVTLEGADIAAVELLPVWVRQGRPEPSADARLLERIRSACRATGTELEPGADGWLRVVSH